MRYNSLKRVDDIHNCGVMKCQAYRLEYKILIRQNEDFWRRRRDSNPRPSRGIMISSHVRYDHFDTSPCELPCYYNKFHQKCQGKNESVCKPSSVLDGHLSRRGIAPSAQAAFRGTSGKCIATLNVAPNRVYRASTFP